MFEDVKTKLKKVVSKKPKKNKNKLAVFVDGPNILRKEFDIDLREIKDALAEFGEIKIAKVFLNQFASNKLVEAVVNEGFESVITVGDVDVAMAVEATEAVFNKSIQGIAFVSRDSDFLPALIKTKQHGKEAIAVLIEESAAAALKNTADIVIYLKKE